jgi:Saccharopine dehydrogenase NADP binding domain
MMSSTTDKPPTILLLGGYGNTGRALAPLLQQHTPANVVIGGRNLEKAERFADELRQGLDGPQKQQRVSSVQVDASDSQSLNKAFSSDVTLVIVVATTSEHIDKVASAALEAKIDFMDIHLSSPKKNKILEGLEEKIRDAKLCFITDGGFHPGVPAAMVRYVAPHFATLEKAVVGSVIQCDWSSCQEHTGANAAEEFASELADMQAIVYKDSAWHDLGFVKASMDPLFMNFGDPFGTRLLIPMHLEEMKCVPALFPSVKATGFYVGGFNWFVDYVVSPVALVSIKLFPSTKRTMGRLMMWGLKTFSKPPYGTLLKLEATGLDEKGDAMSESLLLSHEDAYFMTAVPVAATVNQYLARDRSVRKPGLWRQAELVEPRQFFLDQEKMGVKIDPNPGA